MTQRPVLFRNTQWILNTILKKSFYAILGYSKLMDHNDLVSLNNKRSSVVQESSTNAASQTISSAKFSIVFLNTTRMAILWSSLRKAVRIFKIRIFY
jgi:predicted P-loop ATPase/GTPase